MRADPNPPLAFRVSPKDALALSAIEDHLWKHHRVRTHNRLHLVKRALWEYAMTIWTAEEAAEAERKGATA